MRHDELMKAAVAAVKNPNNWPEMYRDRIKSEDITASNDVMMLIEIIVNSIAEAPVS